MKYYAIIARRMDEQRIPHHHFIIFFFIIPSTGNVFGCEKQDLRDFRWSENKLFCRKYLVTVHVESKCQNHSRWLGRSRSQTNVCVPNLHTEMLLCFHFPFIIKINHKMFLPCMEVHWSIIYEHVVFNVIICRSSAVEAPRQLVHGVDVRIAHSNSRSINKNVV